jgi:hypothetical protein
MISENKDQLIDIYDIWYKPFWQSDFMYIVKIIAIVSVIALLLYYFYIKYIQKQDALDCTQIAYRDLALLQNFHIATKQDSKNCYFSLSLIIKNYLGSRYHLKLSRLTEKEIVKQAENYMTDDNVRLLQKILQGMVFVKFEHEVAVIQKLENDIALVREFIENTTPQPDTKEN